MLTFETDLAGYKIKPLTWTEETLTYRDKVTLAEMPMSVVTSAATKFFSASYDIFENVDVRTPHRHGVFVAFIRDETHTFESLAEAIALCEAHYAARVADFLVKE